MGEQTPAEAKVCTRGAGERLIRGVKIAMKDRIDGPSVIDGRLVEGAAGGHARILEPQ